MLLGITAIFFNQNCAPQRAFTAQSIRTEQFDPDRVTKLQSLSTSEKADICDRAENYFCTQRFYLPKVQQNETRDVVCVKDAEGDTCLDVHLMYYNTDYALEACTECSSSDTLPGGRYNYEESFCFNSIVKSQTGIEDRFDSGRLSTAFLAARAACRDLVK